MQSILANTLTAFIVNLAAVKMIIVFVASLTNNKFECFQFLWVRLWKTHTSISLT